MKTTQLKSILIFTFTVMSISFAQAQDAISKYFSDYAANTDFTSITVSSKMFSLFSNIDTEDPQNKELLQAMSKLNGLKIITTEKLPKGFDLSKAIHRIPKGIFEELMSIDSPTEKVKFLIREQTGRVRELLMFVGSDSGLMIMSITGDIDLKEISKLSKSMNIGGMNYLENLDKDQKKSTK